jgi:hypothetical protein
MPEMPAPTMRTSKCVDCELEVTGNAEASALRRGQPRTCLRHTARVARPGMGTLYRRDPKPLAPPLLEPPLPPPPLPPPLLEMPLPPPLLEPPSAVLPTTLPEHAASRMKAPAIAVRKVLSVVMAAPLSIGVPCFDPRERAICDGRAGFAGTVVHNSRQLRRWCPSSPREIAWVLLRMVSRRRHTPRVRCRTHTCPRRMPREAKRTGNPRRRSPELPSRRPLRRKR